MVVRLIPLREHARYILWLARGQLCRTTDERPVQLNILNSRIIQRAAFIIASASDNDKQGFRKRHCYRIADIKKSANMKSHKFNCIDSLTCIID